MIDTPILALLVGLSYILALLCVMRILLSYRTAQGAIAWIVALLSIPYVPCSPTCCLVATAFPATFAPGGPAIRKSPILSTPCRTPSRIAQCTAPAHAPELRC